MLQIVHHIGVAVSPVKGGVGDIFYCEMYVDDMFNVETCAREGEGRLLTKTFSAIWDMPGC